MTKQVKKRSGNRVQWNTTKVVEALRKANASVEPRFRLTNKAIQFISDNVKRKFDAYERAVEVEEIQDAVEEELKKEASFALMKNFIIYRYIQGLEREYKSDDEKYLSICEGTNDETRGDNANKNVKRAVTQRDYIAGNKSKEITYRRLLTDLVKQYHSSGEGHFHDADFFVELIHNCDLVDWDDMLQNGTAISETGITKPHSLLTAATVITQGINMIASSQYGGQSFSLLALARFVDVSRQKFIKEVDKWIPDAPQETKDYIVRERLHEEIVRAVQCLQYQLITLASANGQSPFVTMFIYLNEAGEDKQLKEDLAALAKEVFIQRIKGIQTKKGAWVGPAFPKIVYVLEEDNIYGKGDYLRDDENGNPIYAEKDSEYYNLTRLAAKCTAYRLVPDYMSEKKFIEIKGTGNFKRKMWTPMGCRSLLQLWVPKDHPNFIKDTKVVDGVEYALLKTNKWVEMNEPVTYGRFNCGVYTINLPYEMLKAQKNGTSPVDEIDNALAVAHEALQTRINRLKKAKAEIAPILWCDGALARLNEEDSIEPLLYDGYATASVGLVGLYEATKVITGSTHYDGGIGEEFANKLIDHINEELDKWYKEDNVYYSIYGTPEESTTEKFAKALQRDFGIIEGITDKLYVTNSYHIPVTEKTDALNKFTKEGKYQAKFKGGAITYIEASGLQRDEKLRMSALKMIYDTNLYAEINTRADHCYKCGFDGEIKLERKGIDFRFTCPRCGNTDSMAMYVLRRICGYAAQIAGNNRPNDGRMGDIVDRWVHLIGTVDLYELDEEFDEDFIKWLKSY